MHIRSDAVKCSQEWATVLYGGPQGDSAFMTRATTSIAGIKCAARKQFCFAIYAQISRTYRDEALISAPVFSVGRIMVRTDPSQLAPALFHLFLKGLRDPQEITWRAAVAHARV